MEQPDLPCHGWFLSSTSSAVQHRTLLLVAIVPVSPPSPSHPSELWGAGSGGVWEQVGGGSGPLLRTAAEQGLALRAVVSCSRQGQRLQGFFLACCQLGGGEGEEACDRNGLALVRGRGVTQQL